MDQATFRLRLRRLASMYSKAPDARLERVKWAVEEMIVSLNQKGIPRNVLDDAKALLRLVETKIQQVSAAQSALNKEMAAASAAISDEFEAQGDSIVLLVPAMQGSREMRNLYSTIAALL